MQSTLSRFADPVANTPSALNLMEKAPTVAGSMPGGAVWFNEARLGMFVHYGLYSIRGRGEWGMLWDKIPPADYNRLADQFDARSFDADSLVGLAKRAGAGYVVFGARHHDGFCLWDTRTTDFNTVRTAARRDLIAEYTTACRRAGLRVGIYYSVMSWQWPAIHVPPSHAPADWTAMADETHAQVRELLTGYGKIDYLWYDGCVVPGLGASTIRERVWRTQELNAMVRTLQPDILINDRAALPEDVTTPEQHITPAVAGRLWEACLTIGDHWGWHAADTVLKTPQVLIENLVLCARFGGNLLLNIGPHADGSLPPEQVARFEALGKWMEVNGSAIRNSERTSYTEAEHLIGPATCVGRNLYFHLSQWPLHGARIAGVRPVIRAAKLLAANGARPLRFTQQSDGTAIIEDLPTVGRPDTVAVVAVEFAEAAPRAVPPSLLIERDTGRHAPAEAPVHAVAGDDGLTPGVCLKLVAGVTGFYDLELAVVTARAAEFVVTVDGCPQPRPLAVECGQYPVTVKIAGLSLIQGRHEVKLVAPDLTGISLCKWRLQPRWRVLGLSCWRTISSFPASFDASHSTAAEVKAAMDRAFPPEVAAFDPAASFIGTNGHSVRWREHLALDDEIINLASLSCHGEPGLAYGRTIVTSPEARETEVLVGCDWWANLYVNGLRIETERSAGGRAEDGAAFNGWKPSPARIVLNHGANVFLLKCHPGSMDNWFTFRIHDAADLRVSI